MKNNTIKFDKVLVSIVLMLEFCVLFFVFRNYKFGKSIIIAAIILLPTLLVLLKQYYLKINIPQPLILIVYGFAIQWLVAPFRGYIGGMRVSAVCGFIICLVAAFLIIRKKASNIKPWLIALYLLIGLSILDLPFRLFYFKATSISFPDYLMRLLGIIAGLFLYQRKKTVQIINLSVSVLLLLFVYFYGYDMWTNRLDYGTITGEVSIKLPVDIKLTDINNAPVTLKRGKVTVMDFWFSRCGPCFDTFPAFQKYYDQYKNNPHIQFYAVNEPLKKENPADNFKLLTKEGYTFPIVAAGHDETLVKALDIRAYPTTVIINEEEIVIYKGDLQGAMATVKILLSPNKM